MNNKSLEDLREDYSASSLDFIDVLENPLDQFKVWFEEAQNAQLKEPNAMVLGTANSTGQVSQRTVLLKGLTEQGFIWYSNYESAKAQDLAVNPNASLLFLWLDLQRQVRIEGTVTKVDPEVSLKYFQSRPRGSQIGAWASPQSTVISDREELEKKVKEIEKRFEQTDKLPLPPYWGGYILVPTKMEFWQGRSSRLHDRILYQRGITNSWETARLAP